MQNIGEHTYFRDCSKNAGGINGIKELGKGECDNGKKRSNCVGNATEERI